MVIIGDNKMVVVDLRKLFSRSCFFCFFGEDD